MKLTKSHLKQLIKEEADEAQNEGIFDFFKSKKKAVEPTEPAAAEPTPGAKPEVSMPSSDEQEHAIGRVVEDIHWSWDNSEWVRNMSKGPQKNLIDFIINQTGKRSPLSPDRNGIRDALLQFTSAYRVEKITYAHIKYLKEIGAAVSAARGLGKQYEPEPEPYVYNPNAPKNVVGPEHGYIGPTGKPGLPMREKRNITKAQLQKIIHEEIKKTLNEKKKVINEKTYIDKSGYVLVDSFHLSNLAISGKETIEVEAQDYTKVEYGLGGSSPGAATLSLKVMKGLPPKQVRPVRVTGDGEVMLRPEQLSKPFSLPGAGAVFAFQVDNLEQLAEEHGWNIK